MIVESLPSLGRDKKKSSRTNGRMSRRYALVGTHGGDLAQCATKLFINLKLAMTRTHLLLRMDNFSSTVVVVRQSGLERDLDTSYPLRSHDSPRRGSDIHHLCPASPLRPSCRKMGTEIPAERYAGPRRGRVWTRFHYFFLHTWFPRPCSPPTPLPRPVPPASGGSTTPSLLKACEARPSAPSAARSVCPSPSPSERCPSPKPSRSSSSRSSGIIPPPTVYPPPPT